MPVPGLRLRCIHCDEITRELPPTGDCTEWRESMDLCDECQRETLREESKR